MDGVDRMLRAHDRLPRRHTLLVDHLKIDVVLAIEMSHHTLETEPGRALRKQRHSGRIQSRTNEPGLHQCASSSTRADEEHLDVHAPAGDIGEQGRAARTCPTGGGCRVGGAKQYRTRVRGAPAAGQAAKCRRTCPRKASTAWRSSRGDRCENQHAKQDRETHTHAERTSRNDQEVRLVGLKGQTLRV